MRYLAFALALCLAVRVLTAASTEHNYKELDLGSIEAILNEGFSVFNLEFDSGVLLPPVDTAADLSAQICLLRNDSVSTDAVALGLTQDAVNNRFLKLR